MTIGPLATPGDAGSPVTSGGTELPRLVATSRRIGEQVRDPLDRERSRHGERLVLGHVDRDAERRLRAALADADLEHPEPGVLDRELDVAEVGVVALEPRGVIAQLRGDRGHPLVEDGDRLGLMGPGDDVVALGVEHDVAVQAVLAGRRDCA